MSNYEKDRQKRILEEPWKGIAEREEILARWERESGANVDQSFFVGSPTRREKRLTDKPLAVTGKTRLEIDFPNPAAMWEWLTAAKGYSLPDDVALYAKDSLDKISDKNTFIVKREGDRPDVFRFVVQTTQTE